jgi:hypothetical protein
MITDWRNGRIVLNRFHYLLRPENKLKLNDRYNE